MIPEHVREEIQRKLDAIPIPKQEILLAWLLSALLVLDLLLVVLAIDDKGWKPLIGLMIAGCTIWGAILIVKIIEILFDEE